ncbi:uncharacterized protein LOC111941737 [Cyanistes caeruleus]|uniref:uncharacterized protein LOC111941737 n=1 Tax=Cyanistes caeruleus TaxID=156563 RepID=UPI000CDAA98B|nr:uncharacterized protein LOC111941737 [Cyanistes caeruleus]
MGTEKNALAMSIVAYHFAALDSSSYWSSSMSGTAALRVLTGFRSAERLIPSGLRTGELLVLPLGWAAWSPHSRAGGATATSAPASASPHAGHREGEAAAAAPLRPSVRSTAGGKRPSRHSSLRALPAGCSQLWPWLQGVGCEATVAPGWPWWHGPGAQTFPSFRRYKCRFFFPMENVSKPNYWLIPLLTWISINTDSQMVAKEGIGVPCTKLLGGYLCSVFCTLQLHQARPPNGFLLFWFCKEEHDYSTIRSRHMSATQCKRD